MFDLTLHSNIHPLGYYAVGNRCESLQKIYGDYLEALTLPQRVFVLLLCSKRMSALNGQSEFVPVYEQEKCFGLESEAYWLLALMQPSELSGVMQTILQNTHDMALDHPDLMS